MLLKPGIPHKFGKHDWIRLRIVSPELTQISYASQVLLNRRVGKIDLGDSFIIMEN